MEILFNRELRKDILLFCMFAGLFSFLIDDQQSRRELNEKPEEIGLKDCAISEITLAELV